MARTMKCPRCNGTGEIAEYLEALHRYVPHPKWPWFCRDCGYPEHEVLKHIPGTIMGRDDAGTR